MPEASRQSAPGAPQPGVPGTPQPGAPETTPRSVPASTPRRSGAVLATTLVALFLVPFTLTGASVALSDIARQLDVGLSDTQWVVNAYSATFAAFMLVTGSWADRCGARRVFAAGVALFAACGLLAATAGNIWLLDAARLLAGIGAAATTTGASAVLAGAFTGRSRARVFGLFGTTIGVGLAFGPTVASQLVDGFGWRAAFALPGLVGAVCLLGVPLLPRPSAPRATARQGDPAGAICFTVGLLALVFTLVEGPLLGWTSPLVWASAAITVAALALFVRCERTAARPLLDLRHVGTGRFAALCLAVAAVVGLFAPLLTYLPTYFTRTVGMTPSTAGWAMLALTAPVLVLPLLCGYLVRWIPARVQVVASLVLVAAGAAWMATGASLLPALLVAGGGVAIAQGLLDGQAVDAVPVEHAGAASGAFNTAKLTAETVGIAAVGAVLAQTTRGTLTGPGLADGLHSVLWCFAALCLASAAAIAALLRRPRANTTDLPSDRRREVVHEPA
ncbi:MFS transporter [Streptomyces sp. NPDC102340]|uniref:MFS transporter n=1 Tax=unclassified Streptomyces TaxID=2593676 RepID=UPI00382BBD6C